MFDPRLIDVAIGVVLLFLLTSLLVTIAQEAIASLFKLRAANLKAALENLIGGDRATRLYKHPLIASLYKAGEKGEQAVLSRWRLPSYIPPRTFVLALLDLLARDNMSSQSGATPTDQPTLLRAHEIIKEFTADVSLRRVLSLLIGDVQLPATGTAPNAPITLAETATALADVIAAPIEQWFNDAMDRAAGWYKRQAQLLSVVIGLAIAILANADTIHVADRLWNDAGLRASVTAVATAYQHEQQAAQAAGTAATPLSQRLDEALTKLDQSKLPVGWTTSPSVDHSQGAESCSAQFCEAGGHTTKVFLLMLAGWAITALAASLGAPFWFDLLSKALQIRSSGSRVATGGEPAGKR